MKTLPPRSQLLRPEIILQPGDCIVEIDRFNKETTIYIIDNVDENYCGHLEVISSDRSPNLKGRKLWTEFKYHCTHKNTRWLTYFMPNGRILYGKR